MESPGEAGNASALPLEHCREEAGSALQADGYCSLLRAPAPSLPLSLCQPALHSSSSPSPWRENCRAGNYLGEFNKGPAEPGNHLKRTCFVPVEKPAGKSTPTLPGFELESCVCVCVCVRSKRLRRCKQLHGFSSDKETASCKFSRRQRTAALSLSHLNFNCIVFCPDIPMETVGKPVFQREEVFCGSS